MLLEEPQNRAGLARVGLRGEHDRLLAEADVAECSSM